MYLELGALVQVHDGSKYKEGTLKPETVHYVQNVLDMQTLCVDQILTTGPDDMVMLPSDAILDKSKVMQFKSTNQTYIFVYEENAIKKFNPIVGAIEIKVNKTTINLSRGIDRDI